MSALFSLREAGMRYDGVTVLSGATLDFRAGEMTAVVGPNGAGKSTLLGIMAGLRPNYLGACRYRDVDVRAWSKRRFAREVSFVPQSLSLQFPFTAEQVVLMGRTPYCDGLFESPEDHAAVEKAMHTTDTLAFRSRDFRSLSGGERQRVVLASALAQDPQVLLLDEPTTFLDLKHQVSIYALLRDLCRAGLLVVAVTHDLNLGAAYSDRVVLLDAGRVVADAAPAEVLTRESLRRVFGVDAQIHTGREGRPWLLYGD
ncbi:MAG: ABC transporter ATP-binding protein [Acidobacteria bacterium]|nr:ABC transporter ATP-binding protein [Acidobacteriota bacterium]